MANLEEAFQYHKRNLYISLLLSPGVFVIITILVGLSSRAISSLLDINTLAVIIFADLITAALLLIPLLYYWDKNVKLGRIMWYQKHIDETNKQMEAIKKRIDKCDIGVVTQARYQANKAEKNRMKNYLLVIGLFFLLLLLNKELEIVGVGTVMLALILGAVLMVLSDRRPNPAKLPQKELLNEYARLENENMNTEKCLETARNYNTKKYGLVTLILGAISASITLTTQLSSSMPIRMLLIFIPLIMTYYTLFAVVINYLDKKTERDIGKVQSLS